MEYMFLPLKRYAEFSGRSRRMEYWMFALFQMLLWVLLIGLAFALVGGGIFAAAAGDTAGLAGAGGAMLIIGVLMLVVSLGLLIPSLAVAVRRLHDTNRSGWWLAGYFGLYIVTMVIAGSAGEGSALGLIMSLVLFGYAITLLVFMFLDGTPGTNKYGADPKGRVDAEVFA